MMKVALERWTTKHYGKRCKTYTPDCPTCRAWSSFDYLMNTMNETMWIKHLDERKPSCCKWCSPLKCQASGCECLCHGDEGDIRRAKRIKEWNSKPEKPTQRIGGITLGHPQNWGKPEKPKKKSKYCEFETSWGIVRFKRKKVNEHGGKP
jgi:hypothetical protein